MNAKIRDTIYKIIKKLTILFCLMQNRSIKNKNLFPLSGTPVKTAEELLLLPSKYPNFDKTYLNIHFREDWQDIKNFLQKIWPKFQLIADSNFIPEFQKYNFPPRSWEIHLFSILNSYGFNCLKPTIKNGSPDLKIELDSKRNLYIEAVVPSKGDGVNLVEPLSNGVHSFDSLNLPRERRILNSLSNKLLQYQDVHRGRVVKENDYYIIAINCSEIEGLNVDDLMLEVLAGVNPVRFFPHQGGGVLGSPYHKMRMSIPNAKATAPIDLAVFDNVDFNEIGAIIYSNKSILHACSNEITVIHNPNVIINKKIPIDFFSCFKQKIKVPNGWQDLVSSIGTPQAYTLR